MIPFDIKDLFSIHRMLLTIEMPDESILGWSEHPSKRKLWTRNGTTNEERAAYFDELYPW